MEARRVSPLDSPGMRALLSPSVVVSLALALTAAVLAVVYFVRGGDAPVAAAPAAAAHPAAAPAPPPEPVEFRCVDGLRVRKQGSSYSSEGRC
ncbi:hypothetical protein J5226_17735 [Lysobacter sp. K5869]|uniref:hypothetical protein n=1 Tax=Lysobacter sp. K5869 TaxID=2820808 RepID=UPI001C0648F1|nr:hypothetical protein [Lysobacter sp. K5869]QWP75444.1 hypothetical protein J5226_17735 [Lysobacter sp. K5869]